MTTIRKDISLGASEGLFRIPVNYKKVEEKTLEEQTNELIDRIKRATPSRKPIH